MSSSSMYVLALALCVSSQALAGGSSGGGVFDGGHGGARLAGFEALTVRTPKPTVSYQENVIRSNFEADAVTLYFTCNAGDEVASQSQRTETNSCTTSGYCTAYDVNPSTGEYESFYGFHSSCQGIQTRDVTEYLCKNSSGQLYSETDEGFWGTCNIQ